MPDVDIIIVNWNAGKKLFECLDSIQHANTANSFHLAKCIVVDNASTDGSLDQLANIALPLELIINTENKGFGFACNQGAKCGSSKYILFLNPDVKLFQDSLSKPITFLETVTDIPIGILGIQMINQNGAIHRNVARFPSPQSFLYRMFGVDRIWPRQFPSLFMTDWTYLHSSVVDQVPGSFFLVRRSLFDELKGFDERFFMYFEDLDFAYRARRAGWVSYYLSNVKAFHHGGGTTDQIRAWRLFYILRSRIAYVAKHFGYHRALWIVIASLIIEVWVRLAWSLIHFSRRDFMETIQAYFLYVEDLPALIRKIKN
jgi:GT2 family glycosyltransferase